MSSGSEAAEGGVGYGYQAFARGFLGHHVEVQYYTETTEWNG